MDTLRTTIPIFLLIGVGYLLRLKGIARPSWTTVLNGFAYYISLPALVLYSFYSIDWSMQQAKSSLLASAAYLLISTVFIFLISLLLKTNNTNKAAFFLTATVGNSVYLGIPLTTKAQAGVSLEIITLLGVLQLVGSMLIALFLMEFYYLGTKKITFVLKKFILNPLFLSMAIGTLLSRAVSIDSAWSYIEPSVKMLAATASPVALFALGCFLYGHIGAKKVKLLVAAVCVKLALDPLLAYVISNKLTSDPPVVHTTMLMAAMPTAVTAFVLAKTYKLNTAFVANAMLVSTVLSVATLSLFVQFVF